MLPSTSKETKSSSLLPNHICRRFSINEILSATQNFDDALVIGRGGFGMVYQAPVKLRSTTNIVAIKRLHSMSNQGAPEFWAEVEMLSHLRHCNLVSLMGYCNDTSEMVLVYEYMPQGTLEDHLHKAGTPLSWLQRLKICIGAARGLDYLHTGTGNQQGVIHRDVKSSNILLDEKFAAKISDFGLAKIGPTNQTHTHVSTGVKGTFGYMDPCYFYTGKLTRKSDVYAFGVVLFEVLCGRPAVDETLDEEQWGLATWAEDCVKEGKLIQIVDSRLKGQISSNCLKEFARIAIRCLHNQPKQRPTMAEVVVRLEFVLSLQERVNCSAVEGTFVEKLWSIFSLRAHSKVNSRMPTHVAGSEGVSSGGDKLVTTPVTVGGAKVEVVHIAAKDSIQFDNASFCLEDLLLSKAEPLSRGNFGSSYRVFLKDGNQVVAKRRKRLCVSSESEVTVLSKIYHKNVLALKACYLGDEENIFVSEYIQKGSVASLLHSPGPKPSLGWPTRRSIIFGITKGLVYLHTKENIIHGHLTSKNVLLDDNYNPLIADVGHSRLIAGARPGSPQNHAPELRKFKNANMKTDVYSLGLIMLELLTGKPTYTKRAGKGDTDGFGLVSWVQSTLSDQWSTGVFDAELMCNKSVKKQLVHVLELAMVCVSWSPDARPKTPVVLQQLEKL